MLRGLIKTFLRQALRRADGGSESGLSMDHVRELRRRGDLAGARSACEAVLRAEPDRIEALRLMGALCGQSGSYDDALRHLNRAAALAPQDTRVHVDAGNVHRLRGDAAAAEACYRRALAGAGDTTPLAHYNLGLLLKAGGRPEEALASLREAHRMAPELDGPLLDLTTLLVDVGQADEAKRIAERAISAGEKREAAHRALGIACLRSHDAGRALQHLDRTLALGGEDPELLKDIGVAARGALLLDRAIAAFDRALELDRDYALARWHRALTLLMMGDYRQGWSDYEIRHLSQDRPQRRFNFPLWKGEPVHGNTLLVYAEQGLGDEIMFASCLPEVVHLAGHCIIDCHPKLEPLYRRSFKTASVHGGLQTENDAWLSRYPVPKYAIPVGSLPLLLRHRAEDFPAHRGYLEADPGLVAACKARLDALKGDIKIGISWRGGTEVSRSALRSIPLDRWLPILSIPGVHAVSLQYTDCRGEIAGFERDHGLPVEHWPEVLEDYDQTAALVCALDLVVSVCTAVVHLGGALGRNVWVMAPHSPEWRYGCSGEKMPWYPSVRLFRQSSAGDWSPVIEAVARRLRDL